MTCVLFLVLVSWCTYVWSVPSSMKTYTMYTEQESWNAANMICSLRGGYLVKIESSSENSFLLTQLDNIWSSGGDSVYIGLHNAALKENTAEYFWTDCTPLGNYNDFASTYQEYVAYCVILYKGSLLSSDGWKTKECTDLNSFICETDGGPCDYFTFNNSVGIKGFGFNATVTGQNECMLLCNEAMLNEMECWGVTYYISIQVCTLHLSNDSSIFNSGGITSSTGSIFFLKHCLHVDVDNNVYPFISSSNIPYTNCVSASPQGSIYTIFERGVTWQEAKDVCSHIGASLLEYKSTEEFTDVQKIAAPNLGGILSFWIGLKHYTNSTYLWQDGSNITSWDKWDSLPSNTPETCVHASTNLLWLEDNCTNSHSFICEQPGVCGYGELSKTEGNAGTQRFFKQHAECIEICDGDSTCIAYSYGILTCFTHHQSDIYYYFNKSNYQPHSYYNFYRYSCSHALRIGNMSVQIPNLYHPSGINVSEFVLTSSLTLIEETSLIQDATSDVSELSEESMETFTISSFDTTEATESLTDTVSSIDVFTDVTSTPALETIQFSDSTAYYTETVTQFTETLGYFSDSLDNLDPSSVNPYTNSISPSSTLTQTTLSSDISEQLSDNFIESSYPDVTQSLIAVTVEPSYTSSINGYGDKSDLVANTSTLQTVTLLEFPTLYPPKQSKYTPMCPCRCVSKVISSENVGNRIQELVEDLTIDKRNLSSTLHSLSSIEDDRPSAQTLGYSSVILLVCVFSFFMIMDITHFLMPRSAVSVKTK